LLKKFDGELPLSGIQTHRQPRLLTIYSINQSRCELPEHRPVNQAPKEDFLDGISAGFMPENSSPRFTDENIHDDFTAPRH
jgi:hypothetical protein